MVWFIVKQVFMTLLEWMQLEWKSERAKDLEILLLRRQLAILERQRGKPRRISRAEKLTLVVLMARVKRVADYSSARLGETIRLFQPETILKWHRELVRRKWTFQRQNVGGDCGQIGSWNPLSSV